MQTGIRNSQPVSPRDITGRRARDLLAEKRVREKATDNVEVIQRESFRLGFESGFESGFNAGWAGLAEILIEAGIDVDAGLALDAGDDSDDESEGGE